MWKCAGRWRRQACTWMHSVTFYLPGGCAGLSYLGLCKAGVKHKALVNDQPQAYDCITLQWICSRWVEYYWWISFFFPTKIPAKPNDCKAVNRLGTDTQPVKRLSLSLLFFYVLLVTFSKSNVVAATCCHLQFASLVLCCYTDHLLGWESVGDHQVMQKGTCPVHFGCCFQLPLTQVNI